MAAVRGGVPDVVELLLKSRANPRLGSAYGKNPFDTAESKGMTEILELFKRYGCRASSAAHDDAGANSDLVEENDEAGIDKLCRKLEGAQKTMGRGKGRGGREKEQQQEKEKNIDADVGNANDLLLLHCGRNTLTEAVLLELLMSGCSIDAVSKEGNSALMIGMKSDSTLHTTRLLTSYGADVNFSAGGRRETPLQYAAREGKQDLVRLLLSKKADVNAQAIHCAAFHGRAGVIQVCV